MNIYPYTVRELLIADRQGRQMNMRDYAEALGVSQSSIGQYENGVAQPDADRVGDWCHSDTPWIRELGLNIRMLWRRQDDVRLLAGCSEH